MKRKTLLIGTISSVGILAFCFVVFALTFSNEVPTSGSTIPGEMQLFQIEGDTNMTSGTVFIYDGSQYNGYSLNCNQTICNTTVNLSSWSDMGTYTFYFFVDGVTSAIYNFTINRVPSKVQGLVVERYNTTALKLNWSDNPESDIVGYRIYRSTDSNFTTNSTYLIANESEVNTSEYIDNGLTTGTTYYYMVTAVDSIGQEGEASDMKNETVADATPPVEPIVNPPSGSTVNTTSPVINIDYSHGGENVSLKIFSGGQLIKDMGNGMNFTWTPVLNNGTTYMFVFNATDQFGNERLTNYTITTSGSADVNFSVIDTVHITSQGIAVKDKVLAGDYVLLKYSLSMYGGDYVRVKMSDLVSATDIIDLTNDTQPIAFCEEDYNATSKDIVANPSKNVYYIKNDYDETQNALNCTDTNAGGLTEYNVYIKIPIPADKESGTYTSTIYWGLYDKER